MFAPPRDKSPAYVASAATPTGRMKIKELNQWPPQDWRAGDKTLASEDALDATDVSSSVDVDEPVLVTVTVTHNDETYSASLRAPEALAHRLVRLVSGVAPQKTLREVGELDIDSEVAE